MTALHWVTAGIDELSAREFHDVLKLRVDVFVVEQRCAYAELDGQDALATTAHIYAKNHDGVVVAAARVLAAAETKPVRIGRVVVAHTHRGTGLAAQLMQRVMQYCQAHYAGETIELASQVGAHKLYEQFGFTTSSADYLDDGIPHRDMQLTLSSS